jgi:hypothetical protein
MRLGIAEKPNVEMTPRGTDATGMVAAGRAEQAHKIDVVIALAMGFGQSRRRRRNS